MATTAWSFVHDNLWSILFVAWGLPLGLYRSRFRKIVYRTDRWTINVLPYFWKETKALVGTLYPLDGEYLRYRNFYRFYLAVDALLGGLWWVLR